MSGNALIWHLVSHAGLSPDGAVIMEGLLIRAKTNDPVTQTQSSSSLSNTGETGNKCTINSSWHSGDYTCYF